MLRRLPLLLAAALFLLGATGILALGRPAPDYLIVPLVELPRLQPHTGAPEPAGPVAPLVAVAAPSETPAPELSAASLGSASGTSQLAALPPRSVATAVPRAATPAPTAVPAAPVVPVVMTIPPPPPASVPVPVIPVATAPTPAAVPVLVPIAPPADWSKTRHVEAQAPIDTTPSAPGSSPIKTKPAPGAIPARQSANVVGSSEANRRKTSDHESEREPVRLFVSQHRVESNSHHDD